jgi:hypothetical protein
VSLVVIAVLAVIWVVALTPMILRKLSERRFSTSVDSFHRQLRGMRRAYPRLAATAAEPEMALCLEPAEETAPRTPSASSYKLSRADVYGRPPRRATQQSARRRRVLLLLVVTTLGFFLLGTIPVMKVMWDFSLLSFAATAGYLALLIHVHRRAVEQDIKIVSIQERLRSQSVEAPGSVVIAVDSSASQEPAWYEEELLGPDLGFDYDAIVAGGR